MIRRLFVLAQCGARRRAGYWWCFVRPNKEGGEQIGADGFQATRRQHRSTQSASPWRFLIASAELPSLTLCVVVGA